MAEEKKEFNSMEDENVSPDQTEDILKEDDEKAAEKMEEAENQDQAEETESPEDTEASSEDSKKEP